MSVEHFSSKLYLATIHVPQNEIGYQFLASFGTNLKIIEPRSYIENFHHFLYEILDKYNIQ